MAKKYVPSGYQIINLKWDEIESGTPTDITAETDDEKILLEILGQRKVNKPILVNCIINGTISFSQYALRTATDTILLGDPTGVIGSYVQIQYLSDTVLQVNLLEV